MSVAAQYEQMRAMLADQCRSYGRDPKKVRLIAVSKTVGTEAVAEAIAAGARDFGENRPDPLMEKSDAFPDVAWHFIGNIQSRRIRDITGRTHLIHSLFQEHHADRIDIQAAQLGLVQDVLLEVNVSGEESKSGVASEELRALLEHCLKLSHLRVCGLMTMAPQGDLMRAQKCFEQLRLLRDEMLGLYGAGSDSAFMRELSMGMSEDWREGVAEGATIVRVGRAIFNEAC